MMARTPHYHPTRWLYWVTFLCASVGGGAWYYLDNHFYGPKRDIVIAAAIAIWAFTTGLALICATSNLWLKR